MAMLICGMRRRWRWGWGWGWGWGACLFEVVLTVYGLGFLLIGVLGWRGGEGKGRKSKGEVRDFLPVLPCLCTVLDLANQHSYLNCLLYR